MGVYDDNLSIIQKAQGIATTVTCFNIIDLPDFSLRGGVGVMGGWDGVGSGMVVSGCVGTGLGVVVRGGVTQSIDYSKGSRNCHYCYMF